MADKQKTDKRTEKKQPENPKKTPDKKLVQLSLHKVPDSIRNALVSDKTAPKKQKRVDSSDNDSPLGASPGVSGISVDLKSIHDSLSDISENMVKKSEMKVMITSILEKMKNDIKEEIITDVKKSLLQEIKEKTTLEIKTAVKEEFEQKIETKTNEYESHVKDISDGFNLDFETLREKFSNQARELRSMMDNLKYIQHTSENALTLANQNQQYSQKNNIKFLKWEEKQTENLRDDLCHILKSTINIDLAPADVIAIHRVPGGARDGPRPVIAKFRDTETKVKVIKNRSQDKLKKHFIMFDHLTPMNAKLMRDLKDDPRIHSAWHFNGKVFALDNDGKRHKFDILDNVSEKLKHRR